MTAITSQEISVGAARLPRPFVLLWGGQLVSNLGSQVSLYALGLWLFQRQQQLATFAAVAIAVQLAKLLVLPLLGRYLGQWPRRRVMLIANGVGSSCTLLLALHLLRFGGSTAVVLACIAVAAAAEATLLRCFSSLIPELVPRGQLGAASGLFASWDGADCDGGAALPAPAADQHRGGRGPGGGRDWRCCLPAGSPVPGTPLGAGIAGLLAGGVAPCPAAAGGVAHWLGLLLFQAPRGPVAML